MQITLFYCKLVSLTLNCATWLPSQKAGAQGFNCSRAAMVDSILLEWYLCCDFFCAVFYGIKLGNKCSWKCGNILFFKHAQFIFPVFDNCMCVSMSCQQSCACVTNKGWINRISSFYVKVSGLWVFFLPVHHLSLLWRLLDQFGYVCHPKIWL